MCWSFLNSSLLGDAFYSPDHSQGCYLLAVSGGQLLSGKALKRTSVMATNRSGRVAVYPGSFDPLTNGHVDIIQRGAALFDRIVVAILVNRDKIPMFSVDERVDMTRAVFRSQPGVEVDTFEGLLVDYARGRQVDVIVRGLRAISDFEYEMQMALMNRRLNSSLETVLMMPAESYTYVSSRLVKEVFSLGGSIRGLVPESVESRMAEKTGLERIVRV